MEYYTYGSDTALRDRTAVELPPADLIEFDNLNHLVLAGLTVKSTRRASGARVVESAGENVGYWHLGDIGLCVAHVCFFDPKRTCAPRIKVYSLR
jgi:hypothetical protein